MAEQLSDAQLETILASIGEHLVIEAPAAAVVVPFRQRQWSRVFVAVAAAAALFVVIALAVAPVRETVARWFGIGSTSIEFVPEDLPVASGGGDATTQPADELPQLSDGLVAASAAEIDAALGGPLPELGATDLGSPNVVAVAPEGGVIAAWADGTTTLWIRPANTEAAFFEKILGVGDTAIRVDGLGDAALLVTGEHQLHTPDRTIAAGTVVIWLAGGYEWRLESDASADVLIAAARALTG